LLCRLLFLSFVESRGWLAGDRRYLLHRFERAVAERQPFFSSTLVPLFFGCLNTPMAERVRAAGRLGRIPYLNGGLFEPSPFERRYPDLHLSNELMGSVIADTFGAFDFQIVREPGAMCIDPEMLGRVFEWVMAEEERTTTGSYYTPRELAAALADSAIAAQLGAEPTEEALQRITILDPACGSGAILLAALDVLTEHWRRATGRPADVRRIVATSLYGVDVKPEAVRLCELRLWLAVAAAHDTAPAHLEALPNLDRNILQGNSLFGPMDFLGDARRDVYAAWLGGLRRQRDLLKRYRTASHSERAALAAALSEVDQRLATELLRQSIANVEATLRHDTRAQAELFGGSGAAQLRHCRALHRRGEELRALLTRVESGAANFFAYDVHFASVLAAGGFDVVIGNPPWVRSATIPAQERRMLAERYTWFRGARKRGDAPSQSDFSIAFVERSMQLARPGGVVAMLLPARVATADYATAMRRALAEHVVAIDDRSSAPRPRLRWFDAEVDPLAVVVRRGPAPARRTALRDRTIRNFATVHGTSVWTLAPQPVLELLQRLYAAHLSLQDALQRRPLMGVKTGRNHDFFLTGSRMGRDHLITPDGVEIPFSAVCRCVRGRDVRRWQVVGAEWMLWSGGHERAPWLQQFAAARGLSPHDLRPAYVHASHVGLRVAWKDISRGMAAVVMPERVAVGDGVFPLVPNQTLYSLTAQTLDDAHALAAVLNSTIAGAVLVAVAERVKDAHYRYFARTIAALPWPNLDGAQTSSLARLSATAHTGEDVGVQIDEIVADAYSVTRAELQHLRVYLAEKLR